MSLRVKILLIVLAVLCYKVLLYKTPQQLLFEAVQQGNSQKVLRILQNEVPVDVRDGLGYTALIKAAASGKYKVVKLLLDHKSDINAEMVFDTTALMQAAWYGHFEIVKLLVENKADIHKKTVGGWTALFFAAASRKPRPEIIKFLLEKGSEPNLRDNVGIDALGWARAPAGISEIFKRWAMEKTFKEEQD